MGIEYPLELIFAETMLPNINDFYNVSDNHREHENNSNNDYPFVRFDLRELAWGLDLPDNSNLSERIDQWLWDEFEWMQEDVEENKDFHPFFDMNGYRLLCKLPIADLWEKRSELEEELENYEYDQDEINEKLEEIKDVDKELVDCAKKWQLFLEWSKGLKGDFESELNDRVVVEEEDGDFKWVRADELEEGMVLWKDKCKFCDMEIKGRLDREQHEEEHIQNKDEFYNKWKLRQASEVKGQIKLEI